MDRYLNRYKSMPVNFRASTPEAGSDSEMDQSQHSDASMSLGAESLQEVEETGDNAEAIRDLKNYIENCEMFYKFSKFVKTSDDSERKRKVHTGTAKCMQPGCKNRGVTYTSISRAHLTSHYSHAHPGQKAALAAALAGNSCRGRPMGERPAKKRQFPVEEYLKERICQDKARLMFTRWFVETLSPISLSEHPYTRELFAYLCPEFKLMSRMTLERDLDKLMDKAKLELGNLLFKQKWVATTADSWTALNRAFLGMTVHWIDRSTLVRKKATLACRELEASQTQQVLRKTVLDVHQEFAIVKKVVAITTDNGANHVTAFNVFGEPVDKEGVQEEDEEVVLGQPIDVQEQLDGDDGFLKPEVTLPPHRRCSSQSLNLMATSDNMEVQGWSKGNTPWRKAQNLWNLQKRSPILADQIKAAVNKKLITPDVVRWSSYYKSIKLLLEAMSLPEQVEAINNIILNHSRDKSGEPFQDQDIKVLTEYRDVLKPVADTLGSLLSEDNAYMGILLPTLLFMKRLLQKQQQKRNELQYAQPLVESLLKSFEKRFGSLFEDQNLLMACALHPSFTPAVLARMVPEQADTIKERIIRELKAIVRPTEEQQTTQAQLDVKNYQDMVFKAFFCDDQGMIIQDEDQVLRASLQDWKPQRKALSWSLFPKEHREAWVDLFIKYNTPLPSSAAVDRVFTTSCDIMRPKRAALANPNFQKLVFLKGNMSLLGYPTYKGQFGEEKDDEH